MIVLYILLFIVCLSTLIAVHEAGHLATAKIFKVYCFEYALGFGPKIFSKKRKDGETYFSIRAIPFGGFVSMYGESETVPEGLVIDPKRSLLAIAKWKRAIIMAAGVTMNFFLAIVIFFVYEVAFPTYQAHYAHININDNSLAYAAGLRSGDSVYASIYSTSENSYVFYDNKAVLTYSETEKENVFIGYDLATMVIKDVSLTNHGHAYISKYIGSMNEETTTYTALADLSSHVGETVSIKGFVKRIESHLVDPNYETTFYLRDKFTGDGNTLYESKILLNSIEYDLLRYIPFDSEIYFTGMVTESGVEASTCKIYYPDMSYDLFFGLYHDKEPQSITFTMYQNNTGEVGKGMQINFVDIPVIKDGYYKVSPNIGVNMQLVSSYNKFGTALGNTFKDFGSASTAIFRGLGAILTTKDGWKEVGGIISIGVVSTQILQQNGFGTYLRIWGLISVNLGIVNLLPFPGLDGWHLLVIGVEAVFRKEIPAKVKNIVAAVGIAILFVLMILIIIKDVVGLF